MSIIDEMTAQDPIAGYAGRRNALDRDIYLAKKMIELSDLLAAPLKSLEQRVATLEGLIAGPRKDLSGPRASVARS